jgi:putative copper resistance protein D
MDNLFPLRVLASAMYNLAYSGAWGVLLAGLWLAYLSPWEVRLHRLLRALMLLLACTLLVQIWLLTATMSGEFSFSAVCGMIPQMVLETQPGKVWGLQFILVVLIVVDLFLRGRLTKKTGYLHIEALTLLATFRAASGHAASYGNFTVHEGVQFIHLVCTAIWSGSVCVSGWTLTAAGKDPSESLPVRVYGMKLSRTAAFAVAGVTLTGIYNAYFGLGESLAPLTRTQWGYALITKVVLVTAALALGGRNRYLLNKGEDWREETDTVFIRSLRTESVVMVMVLFVSAWLANSPPATGM